MQVCKLAVLVAVTLVLSSMPALADQCAAADTALGEQLLRQLWAQMKNADVEMLQQTTAAGFQSVHQNGARTRAEEMALIEGLQLGDYTLSDIRITRNGPVMVATYGVAVAETIGGKRLTKKPAPRLSVFVQTDTGWQWMAHANLRGLQ